MSLSWPALSATKDLGEHPLFRGYLFRWAWRIYAERISPAGRGLLGATLFFLHFALCSLEIQAYVALSYTAALWLTALLCVFLFRPRVRLRARYPDRVCAGEVLPAEVEVEQQGWLAGGGLRVVPHRLPARIDAETDAGVLLPPLARGDTARVRVGLRCARRGVYVLRGFRVETGFPFGLLIARRAVEEQHVLRVYPAFKPLTRLHVRTGRRHHPEGVALASNVGDSLEYLGNREYRYGDNLRDMDWRATARLNRPIVREYREEYFLRVAVLLDTYLPRRAKPEAREGFERAVSVCAAVSDYMLQQDYLVDLCAVGPNLYHLTAGRSLAYLDQILDILANVEPAESEPFAEIEPELLANLSKITTVVCVLLDWNESRRAFVRKLVDQRAGLKVVIVRDGPCTLDPAADAALLGEVTLVDRSRFAGLAEL